MIVIKNLTKTYQKDKNPHPVFNGWNLEVADGEIVALMGPSGVGKTTLLQIIAGLDVEIEGTVEVDGKNLTSMSLKELAEYRNKRIGIIFQDFNLLPHLNAAENALIPLMFSDTLHSKAKAKALQALESVGLREFWNRLPSELSGGQKQRVAIARALINEPEIILADEPTANLDDATEKSVLDLIMRLTSEGNATLIIATHRKEIASLAERIVKIDELSV